ncbi:hypothetical protein HZB07_06825 [Candidatus Saganbacteria bacterium]|nr:hypothetical protein [Candidatus Saganbacteria bacterium]
MFCFTANAKDKLTATYCADINKDGQTELLVHDFFGGTGAVGELRIYNAKKQCIFKKRVEGDPYLWDTEKYVPSLTSDFFPDLDGDGLVEILVGYRGHDENIAQVNEPWWFDVYRWNGKKYVLANNDFPGFFKEQLKYYQSHIKQNPGCKSVQRFIKIAQELVKML